MTTYNMKIPPVSSRFYEQLLAAFPKLDPLDITESTSMISIQRNAAQQEVLEFIKQSVQKDTPDTHVDSTTKTGLLSSIRGLFARERS